jgi:hypothetical protein
MFCLPALGVAGSSSLLAFAAVSRAVQHPLLFLDVDGTVLPTGGASLPETLEGWYATWQHPSNPQLAAIDRSHGPRLLALDCDVVWATAWMHDANSVISPLLGLPALPVAEMGALPALEDPLRADGDPAAELSWKTRHLCRIAAVRPFVWIDDELTGVDRAWVSEHHPGRALLHRVDSATGLRGCDLDVVEAWLRGLGEDELS